MMLRLLAVLLPLGILSLAGCALGEHRPGHSGQASDGNQGKFYYPGGPRHDYFRYAQRPRAQKTVLYAHYRPYGNEGNLKSGLSRPILTSKMGLTPIVNTPRKTAYPNPHATTFSKRPISHQMSSNYQPPKYGQQVAVYNRPPEAFTAPPVFSTYQQNKHKAPPVVKQANNNFFRRSRKHSVKKPYARQNDPCVDERDGEYVLTGEFRKPFPYTDNMCFFVKCANKKAFLNACGIGTRNNDDGSGFCSVLDLEGYCGRTVYDIDPEKKRPPGRGNGGYKEHTHGTRY